MSLVEIKGVTSGGWKRLAAGAVAIAALSLPAAALAQAVVVRSTGPSAATYPMGRKLPANATVVLKAGDQVTVFDKAGSRVLAGPGTYTLNGSVERSAPATAVAALMVRGGGARVRTGAVRGAPMAGMAPHEGPDSVWYLDVSKGGTFCVADPAQLVLWRPNRTDAGTGQLAAADGTIADVSWNAGNALKMWPAASMPVVEGQTYRFSSPLGQTVRITLKMVGAVPADEVEVAAMLADKGCTAQLDMLAAAAAPADPGSGG